MKKSISKLKISLFLSLAAISLSTVAKPVAQVIGVKGQVFVVTPDGKTNSLKANDHVEEKSEIMVGEDGDITLNDYYDATYHLIQGSHLKFFNKSVQLKKGKTWIQSSSLRNPLVLTTANGHVDFMKSEFIATFDQNTSKTQVLVVNGDVEVSNVLDKDMKYTVTSGTFTMVDPELENGLPRAPTKVGLASLNSAMADFKAIPQKFVDTLPVARSIASVTETNISAKKGEIVFMTNGKSVNRFPSSVGGSAHKYFKKKVRIKNVHATIVPIRFYGTSSGLTKKTGAEISPRHPASVKSLNRPAVIQKSVAEVVIDSDFANSLRIEKASQPNHPKELENLIKDLKSY